MNNKQINFNQINLQEGTIAFWIKENKLKWNDGQSAILFNIPKNDGSLFMVKDNDNKLKFFHVILGKGRNDVETDVSNLPTEKPHLIAVTWSIEKKEIALYVDGELKTKSEIQYSI